MIEKTASALRMILMAGLSVLAGCPSPERTTAVPDPIVPPVGGEYHQAQLDLLRVLISSDETIAGESDKSDVMLQQALEHFTDLGFRVLDGNPSPAYGASAASMKRIANDRDVDIFVMLKATVTKEDDSFGNFVSVVAEARGKVLQVSDTELLTTRSTTLKDRKRSVRAAAEGALAQCGEELAGLLSEEILRKSGSGLLLRRLSVTGVFRAADVDYVRVGLGAKPGITSVDLIDWSSTTGEALFWVRMDAAARDNLGAYLESLDAIRLRVERLDTTDVTTRRR